MKSPMLPTRKLVLTLTLTAALALTLAPSVATAADIDRVVVAGTTIVRDGSHRSGSVAPLLIRAIDQVTGPQP